jgi:putative acetyltransferase
MLGKQGVRGTGRKRERTWRLPAGGAAPHHVDESMRMTSVGAISWDAIAVRRIGMDDHSDVRHLHAKSMTSQSAEALSDAEIAAFVAFVRSVAYSDMLMAEDVHGAFIDRQLIGTAAWHVNGDDGQVARISSVFVHPMFARRGLGRRLLGEVEARACQSGFAQLGTSATANAVPFFERLGYQVASRGVKMLGPGCSLPVAFLRKSMPRTLREGHKPAA